MLVVTPQKSVAAFLRPAFAGGSGLDSGGAGGWGAAGRPAGLLGLWPRLTSGPCTSVCLLSLGPVPCPLPAGAGGTLADHPSAWVQFKCLAAVQRAGPREETTWPPAFSQSRVGVGILGAQLWALDSGFALSAGGPLLKGLPGGGLGGTGAVRATTAERVRGPCLALPGTSQLTQRGTEWGCCLGNGAGGDSEAQRDKVAGAGGAPPGRER